MRPSARLTAAVLGVALAACGGGGETGTTSATIVDNTPTSATMPTISPGVEVPESSEIVEAAMARLAEHLGVPADAIEVVAAREVTWPDGAIGCPQPGFGYTQALVDGHQVLLRANDRVYDYHAGSDGEVFLCPSQEKDGGYDFVPPPGDVEK